MAAIRTFVALDLDDAIRGRLTAAAADLPRAGAKIRWVAPQNLHVTVKFLGDVAEGDMAAVCEAVTEAVAAVAPFDFTVRGLLARPSAGRKLQMLWAGVDEPTGQLAAAFDALQAALEPLGFPRERRAFRPHVTLARIKSVPDPAGLRAAAGNHAETPFGEKTAEAFTVYQSDLRPAGPIYTPLAAARFSGS